MCGFQNPLVDGNWGERPEVLMGTGANQNCEHEFKNSEDSGKNGLENGSSWL